jgi:hypothetical protein
MEMKKEYLRKFDAFGNLSPNFGKKWLKHATKNLANLH